MKNFTLPTTVATIKFYLIATIFLLSSMLSFGFTVYNCTTPTEIRNAMSIANPGDEIIIMPGTYEPSGKVEDAIGKFVRFTSDRSGTAANPIILRGSNAANRPLLQCPDNDIYDGAIISITGDYWELKDFRVAQGDKGIMLDTANYCTLSNIDVQDIGEEAIHIRSGSSNNTIDNCTISDTGVNAAGFGEGIYIGSDRGQHDTYDPNCNNNTVMNCTLGPNIRAEHFDIKEGTEYNIVKNCILDGTGITGANFSDSFMDLKGIYAFVYDNTFNVNGETNIASIIDFNNRTNSTYTYKTGEKISIFNNTMNLGSLDYIPTATSRGAVSDEIHVFDNTRNPASPWVKTTNTATSTDAYEFCPTWNIVSCATLNTEGFETINFKTFPNPVENKLSIIGENLNDLNFTIYDINGRMIQENGLIIETNQTHHIDISNLDAGSYIIKVSANNKVFSKLFIKN